MSRSSELNYVSLPLTRFDRAAQELGEIEHAMSVDDILLDSSILFAKNH